MNAETKSCQNCKQNFVIEPEDFLFYEKIKVPPPTWCPECRMVRRMLWRNEQGLYHRKDSNGKDIISIFAPEKPYVIYDQKYWWSDNWDPLDYAREYDFSKPLFSQLDVLLRNIPLMALQNFEAVNSDYCTNCSRNKDCYLVTAGFTNENVMYANRVLFSKDSLDLHLAEKLETSYENINCGKSYRLFFSKDSENCYESYFLLGCKNCSNCFGCVNLVNKSFCIFNKSYSKEEYVKRLQELNPTSFGALEGIKGRFSVHALSFPRRFAKIINSRNVSGDNVRGSKNCQFCFNVFSDAEDCKFIEWAGYGLKDAYDGEGVGDNTSLLYENVMTERVANAYFVSAVNDCRSIQYSLYCYNSSNLFGCIGLRNKQYCILNKQHSKEEYEKLVPEIIQHMNEMPYVDKKGRVYKYGEFFPPELSPFAYNETIAQEYFPLIKEQAREQGYVWRDPESRQYEITLFAKDLPDHIQDAKDGILKETISCTHEGKCNEQCTTAFKIIPQELEFYRKMGLPLPRLCPNCRHYQRLKQRNPLKLWHRRCTCAGEKSDNGIYENQTAHFHGSSHCPNEFETSYAPERPEIVYCEQCYQNEVI